MKEQKEWDEMQSDEEFENEMNEEIAREEAKEEAKEPEAGISGEQIEEIVALQDELQIPMKKILNHIEKKFHVKKIEELTESQARAVISTLQAKRKTEKEKVRVAVPVADGDAVRKEIEIDWANVPAQALIPKLKKAFEYTCKPSKVKDVFIVTCGDKVYDTSNKHCTCENWEREGSSINPCKHIVRVVFTDNEIRAKLQVFGVSDTQAVVVKAKKETKIVTSEQDVASGMVIHGLTPRLAELGKIKIGGKGEKIVRGHLLPQKWDHFAIATLMKDDEGRLVMDDEMNDIIGENCQSLDVYLCYDDSTMNMPTFFSWFAQSKLVCMGNGVVATRTQEDGSKVEKECNPKECVAYADKKCKPHGRLSVILADSNRIGGVYVFRTTSWNSLRNILSSMSFIKTITGGVLAGLPLTMRLLQMSVVPKDIGRNVKIYVVNLEYSGKITELKQAAVEEVEGRLKLGMSMKQMEDADRAFVKAHVIEEAEQEAEDIAAEFGQEEEG